MASATNRTWRGRETIPSKYWNSSYTYYNADGFPISRNNPTTRPIPRYGLDVCSDMSVLENLVWLISSNKDQSLILLHQIQQGILLSDKL